MSLIEKIRDLAVDIYDELGSGYDEASWGRRGLRKNQK